MYNTKDKKLKYQRDWESKNKEKRYKWNKEAKVRATEYINKIKESGCSMCQEMDPCCLDFHHLNPKEKDLSLSRGVNNGWSIDRIQKEIDKCILVCANCHRKIEYKIRTG